MCQDDVGANGWTGVPADAGAIFVDQISKPEHLSIEEVKFPGEELVVAKTAEYAKGVLDPETFNHSMRVYYYGMFNDIVILSVLGLMNYAGMIITKQRFPKQAAVLNPVTWALACLLHDLGTAKENLTATRMSFDIYGGIKALQVLKDLGASVDQAEAAAEAIIRHEDMGVDGTITYIGQLIQLATTYDNTGIHPHVKHFEDLIHPSTRAQINDAHPRLKWCSFFSSIIQKEESIKPWCHSTHLVNFADEIKSNTLMKQWE